LLFGCRCGRVSPVSDMDVVQPKKRRIQSSMSTSRPPTARARWMSSRRGDCHASAACRAACGRYEEKERWRWRVV